MPKTKLARDPEDGKPKPTEWHVTFTTQRTVVVKDVTTAQEAEQSARDQVLFADEFPIDREEITNTVVGWVDPSEDEAVQIEHLEGCWGLHCRHYGCDTSDCAIDHREYCSQCDVDAY